MDFQEFLQFVPKLIDAKLPAFEAHIKMAPLERLESLKKIDFGNSKKFQKLSLSDIPNLVVNCHEQH